MMMERWFFNVICVYTFWLYGVWLLLAYPGSCMKLIPLLYCCGICIELIQMMVLLYYSDRLKQDLLLAAVLPFYPLYQVFMKAVNVFALTREIFIRDSGRDNFVPVRVRNATWRW